MRLLCPTCRTPLPALDAGASPVLTCAGCAAEVDLSRAATGVGRPRFVPEVDRAGERVGRFRLLERLGAGGMGTVYRGEAAESAERKAAAVAVKFLAPALAADAAIVARFEREVGLLRALEHPGIVRVLEQGVEDGVPWFAMELVLGADLRARLAASGPLLPSEIARLFPPLLEALGHAHARGVVHRDIKPANVLLGAGGAKLADFGIARPDGDGAAVTRLTETAAVVGTLPYMSPEQRTGRAVDRRADLFSVGVVLYEAATGRLPMGAFPAPSRVTPAFPAAFDRVVARLLQPEPNDRFASAEEAARALSSALRPFWTRRRRLGGRAGAIAAVALALGVPGLMQLRSSSKSANKSAKVALQAPTEAARADRTPALPRLPEEADAGPEGLLGEISKGGKSGKAPGKTSGKKSGRPLSKAGSDKMKAFDGDLLLGKERPAPLREMRK